MTDFRLICILLVLGAFAGALFGHFLGFSFAGIVLSAGAYAFAAGFSGPGYALIMIAAGKKLADILED